MDLTSPKPLRPRAKAACPPAGASVSLRLTSLAHGGEAVGRLPDGRACFVAGGIPGETVSVRVIQSKRRWARAELVGVVEPSPDRVEPPCPWVGRCGGCQLQHIAPSRQLELKRQVVVDALERIGHLPDPPVAATVTPGAWPLGYRSWARFGVTPEGLLGFRAAASHEVVPIDTCLLLDRATSDLHQSLDQGWSGAEEVVVRTGEDGATVAVHVGAEGLAQIPDVAAGVTLVAGAGPAVLREPAAVTTTVAGRPYRISATSFSQAGPAAAEALVEHVLHAAAIEDGDLVVDAYAGIGLFSAALEDAGAQVVAIEQNPVAVADGHANSTAEVVTGDVAEVLADVARPVDVVVLDPPRSGAGADVCRGVARLQPRTIVYVACDPAALARDAATLRQDGYGLERAVPVDAFSHTAQIEVVATFAREAA